MASEYLKWKYRDVKPDAPIEYTAAEKRRNWLHYHKWHVVIGVVLLLAAGNILYHALGVGKIEPDYQIAYVGADPLPEDTVAALEAAIATLGHDCNGDRRVTVKLHQYVSAANSPDEDSVYYAYAASVTLMADLTDCESYFFLLEDPDGFQRDYRILRRLDGTLPAETDRDTANCYLALGDCPALASPEPGDLPDRLYLARRGFWTDETAKYPEECDLLWEALTKGAME